VINLCEKIEKRRDIHCWKLKKIQYLESTGIQELCEPNKLVIKKVVVAGPSKQVDITHVIKVSNGQVNDCPIDCVTVDTGKLNEYPGCDIEPGYRKIIQIDYVTDEHVDEKKKVTIKKDEVELCHRHEETHNHCHKCNRRHKHCICHKHHGEKHNHCHKCNRRHKHCICHKHHEETHNHCHKCNRRHKHCICHKHHGETHNHCHKCNRRHKHCICHNNHYKPCKVKMSSMLYIPLYPIASPYLCPNPKPCHHNNKCNC
jgi:hypothetical protein